MRKAIACSRALALLISLPFVMACGSTLTEGEAGAEQEGRVIRNELMLEMYPETFRPGQPEYLERDFEAGADFICDEIEKAHERDLCAEPEINWRR